MNLIWMCHPIKKPVGGIKVIYRQAQLAHDLLAPLGHTSYVMHPNTIFFRADWFDSEVQIRRTWLKWRWVGKPSLSGLGGTFDPQQDVAVIPELWARKYGDQLYRLNIPYAIYVQNGYYITKGDPAVLREAYSGARCIMTISDDASRCVAMAFPGVEDKLLRVHYSLDAGRFSADRPKECLITYMPRKLADHSSKVLFFLRNHLPSHWRVVPIDGLNESEVVQLLERSKIFMSFSHFEGCPLPPIEAALCGNQVIGYTGQGALEYWTPDIFETVECGDVVGFAQAVLRKINVLDAAPEFPLQREAIERLYRTYSPEQEAADMRCLVARMGIDTGIGAGMGTSRGKPC